ncbi:MAG: hypothetical protein ACFBSF_14225 [Leptolyngbyaceae cyanobacterium]
MSFEPNRSIRIEFEAKSNLEAYLQGLEKWYQQGLMTTEPAIASCQIHSSSSNGQQLELKSKLTQAELLQGLKQWQESGLLHRANLRGQLYINSSHPYLMQGLDEWVNLNLLTDPAILQLCRQNLHCDLPVVPASRRDESASRRDESGLHGMVGSAPSPAVSAVPASAPSPTFLPPQLDRPPTLPVRILRSLMAELSVIWLLLLGVVLVLLSSGVLVANQWDQFPASGQYSILWAYTITFGVAALWTGARDRLQLTAKALQTVSLFLVPLNFIAMDGFGLWRAPLGLGVLVLATLSLAGLTARLYPVPSEQLTFNSNKRLWLRHLALSAAHGGWALAAVPVLAVYIGIIGTTTLFLWQWQASASHQRAEEEGREPGRSPWLLNVDHILVIYGVGLLLVRAIFWYDVPVTQLGLAIGICGFLLAWIGFRKQETGNRLRRERSAEREQRTGFVVSTQPNGNREQEGVPDRATARRHNNQISGTGRLELSPRSPFELAGLGLMLLGWMVAVVPFPLQALGVSVLALLLLSRRLLVTWSRVDLTACLLVGMQVVWLIWELIPQPGQAYAQALGDRLVGTQGQPWASMSLVFFPYLVGIVVFSDWLARHRKPDLARFSGYIALSLGTVLLLLGASNPTLRIVNLIASTVLLGLVTRRQWQQFAAARERTATTRGESAVRVKVLVTSEQGQSDEAIADHSIQQLGMLTHVCGLLALAATVAQLFSPLDASSKLIAYAAVCLAVMVVEGIFSLGPAVSLESPRAEGGLWRLLRGSAWPLCLTAAGLAYIGVGSTWLLAIEDQGPFIPVWGLMAGLVPAFLTVMAGTCPARRLEAARLSLVGLLLLPPLIWDSTLTRLLGFGVAVGLAVFNTRYLQTRLSAWIAVGYGLAFTGLGLYEIVGISASTVEFYWLAIAISPCLLWVCRDRLSRHDGPLTAVYCHAFDGWAFVLTSLTLVASILLGFLQFALSDSLSLVLVASTLLLMAGATYRSRQLPHSLPICWFSIATILVGQLVTIWQMPGQALALAGGTGLLFLQTQRLRQFPVAVLTVGMALGLEASLLHPIFPWRLAEGVLVAAITMVMLWGVQITLVRQVSHTARLRKRSPRSSRRLDRASLPASSAATRQDTTRLLPPVSEDENPSTTRESSPYRPQSQPAAVELPESVRSLYARACDVWAVMLGVGVLAFLNLHAFATIVDRQPAPLAVILTAALLTGALLLRNWNRPDNWGIYAIGWSLELLVIESLSWAGESLLLLAVANIVLGIATQLLGDWLFRQRRSDPMLSSWHVLPLVYGALGAVLRTDFFTSWTGLNTLGLVIIAMGIGRRKPAFKPLVYLAIAGISATAFELLYYQIRMLGVGDQFVALSALAATMVYVYRLSAPWLATYLRLDPRELTGVADCHWAIASTLLVGSLSYAPVHNSLLGMGVGLFLVQYALRQGRQSAPAAELWVYLGGLEAIGLTVYGATLLPPLLLQAILPWTVALAAGLAVILYGLPWQQWGWPGRPWHILSGFLPLAGIVVSYGAIAPTSLLIAAGFYGFLAYKHHQLRWSYLSLLLVDWTLLIWLVQFNWVTPTSLACLGGLSILYLTWAEPSLKTPASYTSRHYIRVLGTGIMCLVPLLTHHTTGLLPAGISLVAIFAGLILRVRAFLYVGTAVFLLNAVYQLLVLSFTYSLLKWVIGLVAGLAFIIIAANFETRRAQMSTLFNHWLDALKNWE